MKGHKRGITLMETMVVLVILATLAAILFPVFIAARTAVKLSRSKGQMKQLVQSLRLYDNDHDAGPGIALPKSIVGWKRSEKLPDGLFRTGGLPLFSTDDKSDVYVFVWPSDVNSEAKYQSFWEQYLIVTANNPVLIIDDTFQGKTVNGPYVSSNHYGAFWDGSIQKRRYAGVGQGLDTNWK